MAWIHERSCMIAGLALALSGCANGAAAAPEPAQAAAPAPPGEYHVGTGDKLKVSVYNSDKLSGEYLVGGDGRIPFPMLRRVPVQGLTLDQVAALLETRLADGYLLHPSVSVDVVDYRPVNIIGEVEKPGQYPFSEGLTVFGLVAKAGGFTYRASRKTVRLRHEGESADSRVAIDSATEVRPGDTIIILQRVL